jgi:hypothetical protein
MESVSSQVLFRAEFQSYGDMATTETVPQMWVIRNYPQRSSGSRGSVYGTRAEGLTYESYLFYLREVRDLLKFAAEVVEIVMKAGFPEPKTHVLTVA